MAEDHVAKLTAARDRMVENRRQIVEALAKPYERGKTEQWRKDIVEVQSAIRAIDAALEEERRSVAGQKAAADLSKPATADNAFGLDNA